MADPLSIAAGVVGLGSAICKISKALKTVCQSIQDAPESASIALREVEETSSIISQLQSFLLSFASPKPQSTSQIQVNHVVVLLSSCVATYSELEAVLDTVVVGDNMPLLDRLKWASKETEIL